MSESRPIHLCYTNESMSIYREVARKYYIIIDWEQTAQVRPCISGVRSMMLTISLIYLKFLPQNSSFSEWLRDRKSP